MLTLFIPLLVLLAVAAAPAIAVPPMPELDAAIAEDRIVTERDFQRGAAALERRLLLDAYDAHHRPRGTWSEQDRALIGRCLDAIAGIGVAPSPWPEIYEAPYREHPDPQVRFWSWNGARQPDPHNPHMFEQMDRALKEMIELKYSPLRIAGAAFTMREAKRAIAYFSENKEREYRDIDRWYFRHLAPAVSMPGMDTTARRYIWSRFLKDFIDTSDETIRKDCMLALIGTPGLDPWIRHQASGVLLTRNAWQARGSAVASRTTPQQFSDFHAGLDLALADLRAAHDIDPLCAETCHALLYAVYPRSETFFTEGWRWFERSLIAQIDHDEPWERMLWALMPRWHGSLQEQIDLVMSANRSDLYHTLFPYQALYRFESVDYYIIRDHGEPKGGYAYPDMVDAVIQSLEGMIKAKPENMSVSYAHTAAAYLHLQRGNAARAAELLREVDAIPNQRANTKLGFHDEHLPSLVLPFQSPAAEPAHTAAALEQRSEWAAAVTHWELAAQQNRDAGDSLAAAACDERAQVARWQAALATGDWVELRFDESMTGWRVHDIGLWTRIDDSTVRCEVGGNTEANLTAGLVPGPRFELEADIRFEGELTWDGMIACLTFHRGARQMDRWDMQRNLGMHPVLNVGGMGWHFGKTQYEVPCPVPEDGVYRLSLRVIDDRCEGRINGVLIGQGEVPNKREREALVKRVGIAARSLGTAKANYSNIRIRRLTEPAAP
jgi:hypothetical protein